MGTYLPWGLEQLVCVDSWGSLARPVDTFMEQCFQINTMHKIIKETRVN